VVGLPNIATAAASRRAGGSVVEAVLVGTRNVRILRPGNDLQRQLGPIRSRPRRPLLACTGHNEQMQAAERQDR